MSDKTSGYTGISDVSAVSPRHAPRVQTTRTSRQRREGVARVGWTRGDTWGHVYENPFLGYEAGVRRVGWTRPDVMRRVAYVTSVYGSASVIAVS